MFHRSYTAFLNNTADFRHVYELRTYSGGTARDLHPIPYSPTASVTKAAALEIFLS